MNNLIVKLKKCISLAVIYIFNWFPIKKNKIFLFSYYGAQYGCSPKYITQYIIENFPEGKFDVVWEFNNLKSPEPLNGLRKVKTMSLKYFYELCTSKIVITNFRTTDLFVKRKGQYYIQTWHSSLRLKQIEKDTEDTLPKHYIEMAKKDSIKCDLLLSGCKSSTNIFRRAFWYDGEIFEHGIPRNDIFFGKNLIKRESILNTINVSSDYKVILYAPTFRKDNSLEVYDLNYSKILKKIEDKFGGKWVFLVRLHPHLISKSSQLFNGENVIDVTSYDDIQELLSISNILISDYSSLMFDFTLTQRPCFLYIPDIDEYISNDRKLYFNIEELPFISATCSDDLLDKIEGFDYVKYSNDLTYFSNSIGTFETGRACENLLNRINKICFSKKGECYF